MSLYKFIIILITATTLSSCGFTPVYKEISDNENIEKLSSIDVTVPKSLLGQAFKYKLLDIINPSGIKVENLYTMDVKIETSDIPLAIESDQTVTRYKVIIKVEYTVKDLNTAAVISQGYLKREGEYDKVDSHYATYVSEEDTTKRLIKELAEDARLRLIATMTDK